MNYKSEVDFLEKIGSLLLPGSEQLGIPGWSHENASLEFLEAALTHVESLNTFRRFLTEYFDKHFSEISWPEFEKYISINFEGSRSFFQTFGDLFIEEYYSRTAVIASMGLTLKSQYSLGQKVESGNLEMLENVYLNGKKYR